MSDRIFVEVRDVEAAGLPDVAAALSFVGRPTNGAQNLFVGIVRGVSGGRRVSAIGYEIFEPLAVKSFREICVEAQRRWGDLTLYLVHAKGRLKVGDVSVVIAVGSPHRDEGFAACRYLIERLKSSSPIWKLEHYADGKDEWVEGREARAHAQGSKGDRE